MLRQASHYTHELLLNNLINFHL